MIHREESPAGKGNRSCNYKTCDWLALVVILLIGLAVRLVDLTDPPLDFHPARQLHSALIARGIFAEKADYLDENVRGRMVMLGATEGRIEPPLLEFVTGMVWRVVKQDLLWIPRLLSILLWLAGGIPLFFVARRLGGLFAALSGVLFYALLPYGVIASRSFQPDPLMVCLVLYTAWAGIRWAEQPRWGRAVLAGILAGCAILVKQVAVFPLAGIFAGLVLVRSGLGGAFRDRQVWGMAGLAVMPAALYNVYGIWIAGFLGGQYSQRFFPELWVDPAFYLRWGVKLDQTIGMAVVLLAGIGVSLIVHRFSRGIMFGWLIGYGVYGMIFAHHISTHDYYQLPLIPWAALGWVPLVDLIEEQVKSIRSDGWMKTMVAAVVAAAVLFSAYQSRADLRRVDYRSEPAAWEQLGKHLGYESWSVIGMFDDYGARMTYWSLMIPSIYIGELQTGAKNGGISPEFREEFLRLTEGKKYFVLAELSDLNRQLDLYAFLSENYRVTLQSKAYWVFALQSADSH